MSEREIKFRAWDKEEVRMRYAPNDFGRVSLYPNSGWNLCVNCGLSIGISAIRFELMQYTGLKDKNGKESYFDDLVRWGKSIYQVMWNSVEGIAQLIKCSGTEVFPTLSIKEINKSEVIGNKYENSELLEGK